MITARVLATCAAAVLLAGCSADPQSEAARPDREATPTGEPTTGEVIELPRGDEFTTLSAGRYSARRIGSPLRYEVDVPDGWRVLDGTYLNAPTDGHGILFVANVPRDGTDLPVHPCRDHTLWRVGPTESDLARAIADQPVWRVSRPRPVTIDGSRGFHLEIELPARVDPADCVGGAVSEWESGRDGMATERSFRSAWWILDVHGQRLLVQARCYDTCSRDDQDVLAEMVESITFPRG
jgi:hypothetical protein